MGLPFNYIPAKPENTNYGIGIIGSGFIIKECHIPAYQHAGYNIVGITSRNPENARTVANQFGIPKAYESIDALLDDPEIDVVDIAVPPHEQLSVVQKVAAHGKHILAQKPLAMNLADAKTIVDICKQAGVQLVVNQNGRFDPAIMASKQLIDLGYVGKSVMATIELRFKPHWQPYQLEYERLMFLFMSIHHLDQFRYLFGTPDRLYASAASHPTGQYKGEYLGSYILEYDHGLMATAWDDGFTWDPPSFGVFYKIEGTDGVIKMDIGWPHGGPSKLNLYSKKLEDAWHTPTLEGSWFPGAFQYTMGELFKQMETGRPSHISGENNLKTMAMVEACYISSKEKRAVSIQGIL